MPSKPTTSKQSIISRRLKRENKITRILELTQRGYSTWQLSKELDIKYETVSRYLTIIQKRIRKEQARRMEEWLWFISSKYEHLYRQCIEAFDSSKQDSNGKPKPGNVAFIDAANNILRDYRKMLGVDKQPEIIVTEKTTTFSWDSLTANRQAIPIQAQSSSTVDPIEKRLQELNEQAKAKQIVNVDSRLSDGETINTTPVDTDGEGNTKTTLSQEGKRKFVIKTRCIPDTYIEELDTRVQDRLDKQTKLSILGEE